MQLGLTIPLQRHLKINRLPYGEALDRRYCWDLHSITLHGRKSLLAVHCSSRFAFTVFAMSAADWLSLSGTFMAGLRRSFAAAGIADPAIEQYLQAAGTPELTRTHGRREVAFLNRAWEAVLSMDYVIDQSRQHQPLLCSAVNQALCHCAGHEGLGTASERLLLDLQGW